MRLYFVKWTNFAVNFNIKILKTPPAKGYKFISTFMWLTFFQPQK